MSQHDTKVKCVVCALRSINSNVVAEVTSKLTTDITQVPIGPASRNFYETEVTFHCQQCGISYHNPPGQQDAAGRLLAEITSNDDGLSDLPTCGFFDPSDPRRG